MSASRTKDEDLDVRLQRLHDAQLGKPELIALLKAVFPDAGRQSSMTRAALEERLGACMQAQHRDRNSARAAGERYPKLKRRNAIASQRRGAAPAAAAAAAASSAAPRLGRIAAASSAAPRPSRIAAAAHAARSLPRVRSELKEDAASDASDSHSDYSDEIETDSSDDDVDDEDASDDNDPNAERDTLLIDGSQDQDALMIDGEDAYGAGVPVVVSLVTNW